MEGSSNSRTRMWVLAAMTVLVLIISAQFAAGEEHHVGGRKFTITNVYPTTPNPFCPGSTTNTVAFYPFNSDNPLVGSVTIVGEFDGAGIGVCTGNPYAVAPGTNLTYYIYGDWIIYPIPDRAPGASKIVFQDGKLYAIGIQQFFYVSELTDAGPVS